MVGALVGRMRGGAAGQVKRKAAVPVAEAKARTLADLLGAGPVTDPLGALLDLAGQPVALTDALRAMVARLESVGTDAPGMQLDHESGQRVRLMQLREVGLYSRGTRARRPLLPAADCR